MDALLQLHDEGVDLEGHHRGDLQTRAMERAGIKEKQIGASKTTFERALQEALERVRNRSA